MSRKITEDLCKMSVWAVDDDEVNLKLIGAILQQAGFAGIRYFLRGEDVISELEQSCPDLILLDIMMPGISGFDVLEFLQNHPRRKHIPVIIITAVPMQEDMEPLRKSFELGAIDYICKPFSTVELEMRVKSSLRLEKQRQDLEAAAHKIRSLEKLLPICSYCKKVRSDKNYWQEVEVYISDHTDTMFSHSICPSCYEVHVKPQLTGLKRK